MKHVTLKEFESRYQLHDSYIESMSYDEKSTTLTFVINLALWMQKDYVEGGAENEVIEVTFHNVKDYECENGDPAGEFVSILRASSENNQFVIRFIDDINVGYFELKFFSDSVDVKKCVNFNYTIN